MAFSLNPPMIEEPLPPHRALIARLCPIGARSLFVLEAKGAVKMIDVFMSFFIVHGSVSKV